MLEFFGKESLKSLSKQPTNHGYYNHKDLSEYAKTYFSIVLYRMLSFVDFKKLNDIESDNLSRKLLYLYYIKFDLYKSENDLSEIAFIKVFGEIIGDLNSSQLQVIQKTYDRLKLTFIDIETFNVYFNQMISRPYVKDFSRGFTNE